MNRDPVSRAQSPATRIPSVEKAGGLEGASCRTAIDLCSRRCPPSRDALGSWLSTCGRADFSDGGLRLLIRPCLWLGQSLTSQPARLRTGRECDLSCDPLPPSVLSGRSPTRYLQSLFPKHTARVKTVSGSWSRSGLRRMAYTVCSDSRCPKPPLRTPRRRSGDDGAPLTCRNRSTMLSSTVTILS